jgi:hypothetical protein
MRFLTGADINTEPCAGVTKCSNVYQTLDESHSILLEHHLLAATPCQFIYHINAHAVAVGGDQRSFDTIRTLYDYG